METKKHERERKEIVIYLPDCSVFSIKDKDKLTALNMKLKIEGLSIDNFTHLFTKEVKKHWKNKTVPTKFPFDISWEKDLRDEIWYEYYEKTIAPKSNEIKRKIGRVFYVTGRANFERAVQEKNLKVIEDGVAREKGELILAWDSVKGKLYKEILDKFSKIIQDKTEKEFLKRKDEAKNRFKNQAQLAEEVFYQYVRSYLSGIKLSKARKRKLGSIITSENNKTVSLSFVAKDSLIHKKFKKVRR